MVFYNVIVMWKYMQHMDNIPRFRRDMKYNKPLCDLFIVGTSKKIYHLNLERGQFLQPYESEAATLNACEISSEHGLLMAVKRVQLYHGIQDQKQNGPL
ncbi:nucleolar protein 10-like [Haematobia irritans]|uniref:nucleolar protein 10-like n=1 Tax=Haematobia irritans TaxID=7368 RepID=UPI003F50391F